jgi:hypothetical protein
MLMGVLADGEERKPSRVWTELQAASPTRTGPNAFTIANVSPAALRFLDDMAEGYSGTVTKSENATEVKGHTLVSKLRECGLEIKGFAGVPILSVIDGSMTR